MVRGTIAANATSPPASAQSNHGTDACDVRSLLIHSAQHGRPQISRQIGILTDARHRALQQHSHSIGLLIPVPSALISVLSRLTHGVIPCSCKSFLSNRSARNTRSFTAATVIPNASATSLRGRSSTTASTAATRNFGGRRPNAAVVFRRISAATAASPAPGACYGLPHLGVTPLSGFRLRSQSSAACVAIRRAHGSNPRAASNRACAWCIRQKASTTTSSAAPGSRTMRSAQPNTDR